MSEHNKSFFERGSDLIQVLNQADVNGTTTTGDWIKLRDYTRAGFYMAKFGSEDVDDGSLQFLQSKDASGTDSKALSLPANRPIFYKTGTLTSQTVWTQTSSTSAVDGIAFGASVPTGSTRIITDVNTSPLLIYTEIHAADLDADNNFDWVTAYFGNNCNNACLITVAIVLMGGRFGQAIPLSAIS